MAGAGGVAMMPPFTLNGESVRADTPISAWSPLWLAYSRWDAVIVTREDLADLAGGGNETLAVRDALWQYVETGGTLLVLGPGDVAVPASWRRFESKSEGCTVYSPGFGRCVVTPDRTSAKWSRDRWALFSDGLSSTARPWNTGISLNNLNESLPVADDLDVPVRGMFVLMLAFTVLIGPVNLLMLSRYRRRIWMLWTVPVVSLITCVAVFGYMVVSEGWGGHSRVTGLTVLDEVEHRATTVGRTVFYSPLTPSDGLRFSADTEMFVQGHEPTGCEVDWTEGQHLTRGWVSARVPSHYMLRKSERRLEDIKVHREGNALVMVNRLGANIRAITLADEKGKLYRGTNIVAGEKATLQPIKNEVRTTNNAWRVIYSSGNWAQSIKSAASRPSEVLLPRTYLAEVEGSPFLEKGLRGASERESPSLVLGVMADLGS
jgi:hypothetical protein